MEMILKMSRTKYREKMGKMILDLLHEVFSYERGIFTFESERAQELVVATGRQLIRGAADKGKNI